MHKLLHLREDVHRLYVSRKEGRRGLASIQDSVNASIQKLEEYIKIPEKEWLHALETIQTRRGSI